MSIGNFNSGKKRGAGYGIITSLKIPTFKLDFHLWLSDYKSDIINLLTIVVIWIAMVVLANPLGEFPLNDDWVYALAVKSVLETGYFLFPSPLITNVGPQVYWGALFCLPFGFSFTALRVSTLTLGMVGVITLYALVRELGGERRTALLGALVLAVNPLYFGLSNSFMTDVPFVSLVMIALYFLVRGFQRNSFFDLALGLLISFAAILVRQLGLAILLAFAVTYLIKNRFSLANLSQAFAPVLLGSFMHVAYQYWLVHTGRIPEFNVYSLIQNTVPVSLSGWAWRVRQELVIVFTYIGFFTLPFVCGSIPQKPSGFMSEWSKSIRHVLITFAALIWIDSRMMPSSGNVLIKSGLGPLTLHDAYVEPAVPVSIAVFWGVVTLLAAAAAGSIIYYMALATRQAIVNLLGSEFRPRTWSYSLFVIMGAAYLAALLVIGARFPLFDRYLLPLFPLYILLISGVKLERQPLFRQTRVVLSLTLLILYGGFSVAATHDYLSWNRSRWIALHSLIDDGKVRPDQIDGGYEFNGWFLHDAKDLSKPGKSGWVDDAEYIITFGPLAGYAEVRRYPFHQWLFFSESNIFILYRSSPLQPPSQNR